MPLVAGKHFPYTSAGRKAADARSAATGAPVRKAKPSGKHRAMALRKRAAMPMHGGGY